MQFASSLILQFCLLAALGAQPSQLIVRAKAKDAKFIGTSVGSAMIIVRDAITGEMLAQGLTEGSTSPFSSLYPGKAVPRLPV